MNNDFPDITIIKDRQRKWKLALLSMALLTIGLIVVALVPALIPTYTVFSGAIITMNGVYGSANIANKWVTGKTDKQS